MWDSRVPWPGSVPGGSDNTITAECLYSMLKSLLFHSVIALPPGIDPGGIYNHVYIYTHVSIFWEMAVLHLLRDAPQAIEKEVHAVFNFPLCDKLRQRRANHPSVVQGLFSQWAQLTQQTAPPVQFSAGYPVRTRQTAPPVQFSVGYPVRTRRGKGKVMETRHFKDFTRFTRGKKNVGMKPLKANTGFSGPGHEKEIELTWIFEIMYLFLSHIKVVREAILERYRLP